MKVSVVIPVYNVARSLRRCLDSLAAQTFRDFEVIAVDDGSTDGSGDLLAEFASAGLFPMRVIRQKNQGQSVARNVAMSEARGEYVQMVDADDFVHSRLLELVVGIADQRQLDFVLFDFLKVVEADCDAVAEAWRTDRESADVRDVSGSVFDWFVRSCRWPVPWQILFRRSTLAGMTFRPNVIYEDVPFVLAYLSRHENGVALCNRLYGYVQTEGSTTHMDNWVRRIEGHEAGMRALRLVLDERQYRLFSTCDSADWIRCLWRDICRLPRSEMRSHALREMCGCLARCNRDDLLRAADFPGVWKLRFLLAAWLGKRQG